VGDIQKGDIGAGNIRVGDIHAGDVMPLRLLAVMIFQDQIGSSQRRL
jgi:hypothetical protein